VARFLQRYLDPSDSLAELLFGMIMALSLTAGARLLAQRGAIDPHELIGAMIGCNIAWGVIDAVLYLIGSLFNRNRRVDFVRRLRLARTEADAMAAITREFGLEDEPALSPGDRAAFHRVVLDILRRASAERVRLRAQDLQAAIAIVVLVSLTAIPGVLPLLVIDDGLAALRWANGIQTVLLFLIGFRWARFSSANPWVTGLAIVALALSMVLVSVLLGG